MWVGVGVSACVVYRIKVGTCSVIAKWPPGQSVAGPTVQNCVMVVKSEMEYIGLPGQQQQVVAPECHLCHLELIVVIQLPQHLLPNSAS